MVHQRDVELGEKDDMIRVSAVKLEDKERTIISLRGEIAELHTKLAELVAKE